MTVRITDDRENQQGLCRPKYGGSGGIGRHAGLWLRCPYQGLRVRDPSFAPQKLNSCRGAGSPEQRVGKHGRNDAYIPCESALPVSVFENRKCRPPRAIQYVNADMVELVDTSDSGSDGSNTVKVQVLLSAPVLFKDCYGALDDRYNAEG